jgi:hypothetical protein
LELPSESELVAIAEPEDILGERYITCFDCLFDPHQEAVDAYSLYGYLKENHIPCKYILRKGHRLEQTISDPDVIVVSGKADFIANHGDIIRRSKALVTSFGFGIELDKHFFGIDYLDYVFIEHGVIFLKKGRVLDRYNTSLFNKMIVPTRLTYELYKGDIRYKNECLILSGIPRWDYLNNDRNGHIFVFFTWRTTFQADPKSAHSYIKYIEEFVNKLAQSLDNNVEIDVAAHHELGKIGVESYHFENAHVHLVETDDISSMIRNTSLLITDYSSVAFDFMYQDKPVVFYKFDRDALYLNHTDLIACLEAMQEDEKLYNCLYSEEEVFDRVRYYVSHNFELEDELKEKNSQIFWERNNDCCAKLADVLTKLS